MISLQLSLPQSMVEDHDTDSSKPLLGFSQLRSPAAARYKLLTTRSVQPPLKALQAQSMDLNGEGRREGMLHHFEKGRLSLPYLKKSIVVGSTVIGKYEC
jgi:hypothetical protein